MELKKGRGYSYCLNYYLAWHVHEQKELLTPPIQEELLRILQNLARENKIDIVDYQFESTGVVLHLSCTPQQSIPDIVKTLKGVSGRLLMKAFRNSKYDVQLESDHLWEPNYMITTNRPGEDLHLEYFTNTKK